MGTKDPNCTCSWTLGIPPDPNCKVHGAAKKERRKTYKHRRPPPDKGPWKPNGGASLQDD